MASIKDHGDGRFTVRWRDPDGKNCKRTFGERGDKGKERAKNQEAAEAFKADRARDHRAGRRYEPRDARPIPSIGSAMSAYLRHMHERAAPRTVLNIGFSFANFRAFLGGDWSKVPVTALTVSKLEAFYEWLGKNTGRHGKPRSLDTRAKNVRHVELGWKWAANADAFAGIIPPPRRLDHLPSDPGEETDAPTWAEMDAAIAEGGSWYPLVMGVQRALGLRVSQTVGLQVRDIREDERGLYWLNFRGELGKTKQERRGRRVPIASAVRPLIDLLIRNRASTPEAWLIPDRPATLRPLSREGSVLEEKVSGAWKRAGVREEVWKGRPNHAFRKGFNSGLRQLGNKDAVEFIVGHSLGLSGIYTAAFALGLRETVEHMPPFSDAAWAAIERAFHDVTNQKAEG